VSVSKSELFSRGTQWSLEVMAVFYVAVTVLFLVDADWPILVVNKAFSGYGWPPVFFPTEKFWFSLAVSVPATRAYLAFAAAKKPVEARLFVRILCISLVITAALFAWQFVFRRHAALYALGFLIESVQVVFYLLLHRKLR
jgi:hypothetical protein